MLRLQAYRFEVRPSPEQANYLQQTAGCCRYVYNRALAIQNKRRQEGQRRLGYVALAKELTGWRHCEETSWLGDAPVHPLQQALIDLKKAFLNFQAGRAEHPVFKKKGKHDAFRYPDPLQIELDENGAKIFLPKLGWVKYRRSRKIKGGIQNVTVSKTCERWFISIQTERNVKEPVHPSQSKVGIDMGIARFATISDGAVIEAGNIYRKNEARLAKAQRRLSRKVKYSRNWRKAKAGVARIQNDIANMREDFLHQNSSRISQNHAVVVLEDLKVKNMSGSARGTKENPGKNVKAKSGLNKSILDQGWGEFRRQLGYKLKWAGGKLVLVPAHHTSQTCPECGHVSGENRKSQAKFRCVACGYENHADLVGAMNILSRGMDAIRDQGRDAAEASAGRGKTAARIACGGKVRQDLPKKQEPPEEIKGLAS